MYLVNERRDYILRLLEERGTIRTVAVARDLGVTDETVRTDILALERDHLLRRVHGGAAYLPPPGATEPGTELRAVQALAAAFVGLLRENDCIFLDGSPVSLAAAAQLPPIPLTVASNSIGLLETLSPRAMRQQVFSTGGFLDKETGLFIGSGAVESLRHLGIGLLLTAPDSVTPEGTPAYRSFARADFIRQAAPLALRVCIACPASRFGSAAPFPCPTVRTATLITEDNLPETAHEAFLRQGAEIVTVPYISPAAPPVRDEFDY